MLADTLAVAHRDDPGVGHLPVHAAVPRQLDHAQLRPGDEGRRHHLPGAQVLRLRVRPRPAPATGSPTSTTSAAPSATSWRCRRRPTTGTSSLQLAVGTEASVADIEAFSARFGCRVSEGYGQSEGVLRINRTPETPPDSLGLPVGGVGRAGDERGDRRGVPARQVRRARPAAQPGRGDRSDRGDRQGEELRGLLQEPRGLRRAGPRRRLLDRRPRLPGRRRVLLLRRALLRLAAGGQRELLRRAGGADPRTLGAGGGRPGVRGT